MKESNSNISSKNYTREYKCFLILYFFNKNENIGKLLIKTNGTKDLYQ